MPILLIGAASLRFDCLKGNDLELHGSPILRTEISERHLELAHSHARGIRRGVHCP